MATQHLQLRNVVQSPPSGDSCHRMGRADRIRRDTGVHPAPVDRPGTTPTPEGAGAQPRSRSLIAVLSTLPTVDRGRSGQISTCLGALTLPMRTLTAVISSAS